VLGGWRTSRVLAVLMAACVLVPTVAWAGKRVIAGQQSLQIKVALKPNRAGARGVKFELRYEYTNPKAPGQQPPYNSKSIIFTEPKGLVLNPSAVPSCRESAVVNANDNASVCPAASMVGNGTVTANARPAIPTLISGTVTIYNGVDDGGYAGFPKGSRELILYVKTSIGINAVEFFHAVKTADGGLQLVLKASKPATPGVAPGSFTLQSLDLTIASSSKKPYLSNPGTCPGSWPVSLMVTNWFGQPSITARDQVSCTSH
jgi:hypothetical protein